MSKKPKKLYVAICENKVVCYHVGYVGFYKEMKAMEPKMKSSSYYEKELNRGGISSYVNTEERKTYFFEKILND